jgi:hypothetical protein
MNDREKIKKMNAREKIKKMNAREKIKNLASDKISPYRGSYIPDKTGAVLTDTKYFLLFFYILIALLLVLGSVSY